MPPRFRSLSLSIALLLAGVAILLMTELTSFRFPRAEAAGYLFTAIGVVASAVTGYFAARYVEPVVGCRVHYWGADGRTKLVGRIARRDGARFVVESDAGAHTLTEDQFLRVERG